VLKRDRQCDGQFVYVALTTGIYCRPSCPARHPNRRNVLGFWTAAEAEREGYIACRRCHPGPDGLTPAEESVKAALDYIEAHLEQAITLDTLSQVSGLSPNHLQQMFKRIVGLSPKALCDARRLARFKQLLRLGGSISSACYGAGYGSSRALYERASKGLGMTPATYQRGGDGIHIRYTITDAALGRTLIAGTHWGIGTVLLGTDDDLLVAELREEFPNAASIHRFQPRGRWIVAVRVAQREDILLSKLPLHLRQQIFHAKVWKALQ
jgi:AraC family transcriptional regulator, regulatory protein of adaptative response / methylated-DNA-[protein]-cysteine methyltransferase